ncbi:MAG: hypothetical protein EON93_00930 [Burkholderiales bacterium]|nr:MAG: hypothetical protein EON93_00930 [Burkholderiales bacterium]
MTSSEQTNLSLKGLSVIVLAADFLMGLSITVYLKQMGALPVGPLSRPSELVDGLTRFERPDVVVVQVTPGECVAPTVQRALAANAIPLVTVDQPMSWERSLYDQLVALKSPRERS